MKVGVRESFAPPALLALWAFLSAIAGFFVAQARDTDFQISKG